MSIKFHNYKFNFVKKYSVGTPFKTPLKIHILNDSICYPFKKNHESGPEHTGGLYTHDHQYVESSGIVTHGKSYIGEGSELSEPIETLHGKSLYIGLCHSHYGHFIIETLTRLWPYKKNELREFDHLIILPFSSSLRDFSLEIFEYLGVKDRIKLISSPTRLEEVHVPDLPISYPGKVHSELGRLNRLFELEKEDNRSDQPLFISRTRLIHGRERIIIGEQYIENILKKNGVKIFHPQYHSVLSQIATVRKHKTVIGFAGSALHTILLSAGNKTIYSYSSRSIPSIFPLIDKVLNNNSHYLNLRKVQSKGLCHYPVGFMPQLIDPKPLIKMLFKEKLISDYSFEEYDLDIANNKITNQYNTAVLLRYIHEKHHKNEPDECKKVIQLFIAEYSLDNNVIKLAISNSSYVSQYFEGS